MKYGYLKTILCISVTVGMIAGSSIPLSAEVFTVPAEEVPASPAEEVPASPAEEVPAETPAPETNGNEGSTSDEENQGTEGEPAESEETIDGTDEIINDNNDGGGDSVDDGELVINEEDTPQSPTPVPADEPQDTPVPASPTPVPEADPAVSPVPTEIPEDEGELIEPDEDSEEEIEEEEEETEEEPEEETEDDDIKSDDVAEIIDRIEAFRGVEITEADRDEIESIRAAYDALSDEDKAKVTNYDLLLEIEGKLAELDEGELVVDEDDITAVTGAPVYYTDMVSNLHAGKEFYLNSLKDNYQISFSDDFKDVMEEIESEYKEANRLVDLSDVEDSLTTISGDTLLVRNWQDILAIYVYEESKKGETEFELNRDSKTRLAEIFAEMNPVVKSEFNETRNAYADRHINYYIKENNISEDDREILKKYVETDCKLLCAVVTASKGFVRESVGDDVSEERVNVISAAYSLVGKVGYFWGGKSVELGEDPSWGTAEKVTAEGSSSTGTTRAYGLDCSGFVTWAVVNGYQDKGMQETIGDGTTDQWLKANVVSEADAQPGDLVFQKGPESGQNNHVGILCGKTDAGDWIAIHCSSGKNGVTVGEAYGASFRYIRQPDFYPTEEEIQEMLNIELEDGALEDGAYISSYIDSGELVDNSIVESFGDIPMEWLENADTIWVLDDSVEIQDIAPEGSDEAVFFLIDNSVVEFF